MGPSAGVANLLSPQALVSDCPCSPPRLYYVPERFTLDAFNSTHRECHSYRNQYMSGRPVDGAETVLFDLHSQILEADFVEL